MDYSELQLSAEQVARRVGARVKEVLDNSEDIRVSSKSGETDLVTEVDLWVEKEVKEELLKKYPDTSLVGEESVNELSCPMEEYLNNRQCWIVDPIDGTNNFVNGIPQVGVSIAFYDKGSPKVGVVYDPARDEMFSARDGAGAFLNDKPIRVSDKTSLIESIIATGFPYQKKKQDWQFCADTFMSYIKSVRGVRRFGAATLDGCWVACGRFDGFYEFGLSPWDVAAIAVIIKEAGGQIGNLTDTPREFSLCEDSFIFAPPKVFDEMLSLMQGVDR